MADSPVSVDRLRAWSYRRQQLGGAAERPLDALREVVAVYSSHPTAPLALLSRCATFGAADLGALEERREVMRLPAMRLSIFLMPTETAPRIVAATRQPMEKLAGRLRYAGLDWETYAQLKRRILEHTQQPISSSDLQAALNVSEASRAEVSLMTGVRLMAYEGLILRLGTSLLTDSLRYVAAEAWLGRPLAEADAEESLRWLAREYLHGYGPARVEDLAWWAGVTRRRASTALSGVDIVDIGGGLLLPADQRDAFDAVAPLDAEAIDLLPKWDAYTMGYAPNGRQRLVDDAHLASAYSPVGGKVPAGDGYPLLLRGGRAVARWSQRFAGRRMVVTITPFVAERLPSTRYERAFDAVGRLLGARIVEVTEAAPIGD